MRFLVHTVNHIGKSTRFWKIYIFAKTAVFVACITKSLNMCSEWENIKECNKYLPAILNIRRCSGQKKKFVFVLFQFPIRLFITFCYVPKMHHLDMIFFRSNMNRLYLFMVLLHCQSGSSLTHCAFFTLVYILPSKSPNGILFNKQYFQIKIANKLQCV